MSSSGSRVFGKSLFLPSLASASPHNRNGFTKIFSTSLLPPPPPALTRVCRMSSEASSSASPPSPSSAIDFLSLCHNLKSSKRAGWVKRDIKGPESNADHMYRMGLMSLTASDLPGVNRDKCIKRAIVHDIAEAIVGDITPSDGVPKLEKSRLEQEALEHMCKLLGGGSRVPEEIHELWMEYEGNATLEAKLVKDFDKLEMILQALEYENEKDKDFDEFFQSTAGKFQTDMGKAWASEIASRRRKKE